MRQLITTAVFLIAASLVPASAHAADYLIYVGGMCSTGWQGGKGNGYVRDMPNLIEKEAFIDQRYDTDAATRQFRDEYLDVFCTGNNTCRLMGYSNGGAVISRALSVYGNGQWNIAWVMNNGSNEGGSEVSSTGWVAEILGGCDIADEITPSRHRTWDHHDTQGTTIYQLAGTKGFGAWYDPRRVTSGFLPGEDDGAVAMHSGGGFASAGSRDSGCESGRWSRHQAVYWCWFDLDHYDIKMRGAACYASGCDYD